MASLQSAGTRPLGAVGAESTNARGAPPYGQRLQFYRPGLVPGLQTPRLRHGLRPGLWLDGTLSDHGSAVMAERGAEICVGSLSWGGPVSPKLSTDC